MSRGPHLRCGDCPRRDRNGTCLVRAKFMSAVAKACTFGRAEHHRRASRELANRRYHENNPTAAYKGSYAGRKGA